MKETIAYKQQKTLTVKNESFSGLNLQFNISLNRTIAQMGVIVAKTAIKLDSLKNVYATVTLKGQSSKEIRIYDNVTLYDILVDSTSNDKTLANSLEAFKLKRVGEETVLSGIAPLPTGIINLKGNQTLDVDIRFNGIEVADVTAQGYVQLASSSITVSTKNVVAKQSVITTLERISLDNDKKKKYDFQGNVSAVAFCQVEAGTSYEFIEARIVSDIMDAEITLADAVVNSFSNASDGAEKPYLPLLAVDTPLKELSIEIQKANENNVNSYLLVRRQIIPLSVFRTYQKNASEHKLENMTRLLSN